MSEPNVVVVVCSAGLCVTIDTTALKNCPEVLGRFLGIVEGFSSPEVDEFGRLTFAANFDISRKRFLECITFLRTGYVRDVFELMETFNIIGGCDTLDKLYEQKAKEAVENSIERKKITKLRMENPLCPEENIHGLFQFEVHPYGWTHDNSWEVASCVQETPHVLWWRKKRQGQEQPST